MQQVGRSVSIVITCLLSIFQNITISPMNSCWKDHKERAPKYIGFSISLCWILYMVACTVIASPGEVIIAALRGSEVTGAQTFISGSSCFPPSLLAVRTSH
ncbi:Hypothetical predicted protein [Marmota monax]|uniref:Vomeronasal type-1 receptor n=1 Tax=Marmota monax TaxID=9995 RepID=A0A5E4D6B0_MARMO|nr:Hypothetical predicted protein [Marmota monax]